MLARTTAAHRILAGLATTVALAVSVAASVAQDHAANDKADKDKKKPSVSLKSSPAFGFAPVRMVLTAELKGGSDHEELYCPEVEWVWGDDTKSEQLADCDPYEPGKSEIKRRYVVSHTFQNAGIYEVQFWLKQKDKRIVGGRTTITVRPGLRDGGD
jgi:hypothetical protein